MGLCLTGIRQAFANCSACATSPCGSGSIDLYPNSDTTQSTGGGAFSKEFCFAWAYPTGQPDIIAFELSDEDNIDIDSVAYDPALINFTDCCQGVVEVTVSGELNDNELDGVLVSKGWAWTPYLEDTHTLSIDP